jgi:hypothetical protein
VTKTLFKSAKLVTTCRWRVRSDTWQHCTDMVIPGQPPGNIVKTWPQLQTLRLDMAYYFTWQYCTDMATLQTPGTLYRHGHTSDTWQYCDMAIPSATWQYCKDMATLQPPGNIVKHGHTHQTGLWALAYWISMTTSTSVDTSMLAPSGLAR